MKMQKKIVKLAVFIFILSTLSGCFWGVKKSEEEPAQDESATVKKQPEVQTTASGLQYIVLQPASDDKAASPEKGNLVTVDYTGWLYDEAKEDKRGKKFDSSIDRGQPFSFFIGKKHVIAGWDEGVMSMKKGETRRLIIPAALAYGDRGVGTSIPPKATLVFDVKLLDFKK